MSKVLNVNIENCTGCKMCELACSMKKTGEYNPEKSRIHVNIFFDQAYAVPVVCSQCKEAWCENSCPTGAISTIFDEDKGVKIVKVAENECVGCKICLDACPSGAMSFAKEGCAIKCDLCDGEPECVNYCARGALHFVELSDVEQEKWKAISDRILANLR